MDQAQFDKVKAQKYGFQDLFPLAAGEYTFSLLVKNEASKEFTSVEKALSIPDGSTLTMGDAGEGLPHGSRLVPPGGGLERSALQP